MKRKAINSNLKLADSQTEEQKLAAILAVSAERIKEDDSCTLNESELREVLMEFVSQIDKTFAEAAFQFASGLANNSGTWTESVSLDDFINKLHPWLDNHETRIRALFEETEVRGDPKRQDIDEDYNDVKWWSQETGYKLGILVGARLAGYTPDKVRQMAEYLVNTLR